MNLYQPVQSRYSLETISVWALIATAIVAIFIFIPSFPVPSGITKTYVLAAGTIITLALYILARLGRGNIIFPPFLLIGALWLPVIAYVLSSLFSGIPFASALWGSNIETDTFSFILILAFLGTLSALILRRSEHYRSFLRAGAATLGVTVILQIAIVIFGQFAPNTISPSFSIIGSFQDLAFLLGLGVIGVLISLREFELSQKMRRALMACGVGALLLLAIANSSTVWILLALVSLGLFVETIMQRGPKTSDADLDDVSVMSEISADVDDGNH